MKHLLELIALFRLKLESWQKKLAGPALKLQPIPIPTRTIRRHERRYEAFTMIEIAISLAVIGFALVAIIGILPFAMNVQKENRQETLINQDASVFLNAVRNGERGIDDLTNYVAEIRRVSVNRTTLASVEAKYTFTNSTITPSSGGPEYPITNGLRIVGLLSTPRYDGVWSNYVVAYVRSLSGLASEKFPQNSPDIKEFSFTYRMLPEVLPAGTNLFDPSWTNFGAVAVGDTNEWRARSNLWILTLNTQTNYHDVRLLFRFPYIAGQTGKGRLMFRGSVSGLLIPTNEPGFLNLEHRLYFFEPRSYAQIKP
jgi:type II secretory pathway pseudopilin PulG